MSANIYGLLLVLLIFGGLSLLNLLGYLLYLCYQKYKNYKKINCDHQPFLSEC